MIISQQATKVRLFTPRYFSALVWYYFWPKSCGKVMFSVIPICQSVHRGPLMGPQPCPLPPYRALPPSLGSMPKPHQLPPTQTCSNLFSLDLTVQMKFPPHSTPQDTIIWDMRKQDVNMVHSDSGTSSKTISRTHFSAFVGDETVSDKWSSGHIRVMEFSLNGTGIQRIQRIQGIW